MIEISGSTRVISKLNTIFSGQTLEPLSPKYSNIVLRISPEVGRENTSDAHYVDERLLQHLFFVLSYPSLPGDARIVTNAQEVAATDSLPYLLC